MSTKSRLVQLPNGDWIDLSAIMAVVFVERDDDVPDHVQLMLGNGEFSYTVDCDSPDEAREIRDQFAAIVNGGDA